MAEIRFWQTAGTIPPISFEVSDGSWSSLHHTWEYLEMINLLPGETKKQLRAARLNTVLIRYIIFLILAVVFLGAACTVSYLVLANSKSDAEKVTNVNQSKPNSNMEITKQADQISASLSSAKSMLDQQIKYSDIIMGIGAAMPPGTIISALTISSSSISSPLALKVNAKVSTVIANLQTNFEKSTLFTEYTIQSTTTNPSDTIGHPIQASVSIVINRGVNL